MRLSRLRLLIQAQLNCSLKIHLTPTLTFLRLPTALSAPLPCATLFRSFLFSQGLRCAKFCHILFDFLAALSFRPGFLDAQLYRSAQHSPDLAHFAAVFL